MANPSDPDHGPLILSVSWTLTTLALILIVMRFHVRINILHALGADDWVMLLAGACLSPWLQLFSELIDLTGSAHCLSSMYHRGLPLGTWETRFRLDGRTTYQHPEMGLDIDNSVHFGVHCSQNIHHDSSHSNLREKTLVQDVPDLFYHAPIHCGDRRCYCCLGTVQPCSRALEPDHTGKPLASGNSTGFGLFASMFRPSILGLYLCMNSLTL